METTIRGITLEISQSRDQSPTLNVEQSVGRTHLQIGKANAKGTSQSQVQSPRQPSGVN